METCIIVRNTQQRASSILKITVENMMWDIITRSYPQINTSLSKGSLVLSKTFIDFRLCINSLKINQRESTIQSSAHLDC
jgi:hypothetical protein